MVPKVYVLKAWSPAGGPFRRWLDHKGSDLIGRLVHWWLNYLTLLLGGRAKLVAKLFDIIIGR